MVLAIHNIVFLKTSAQRADSDCAKLKEELLKLSNLTNYILLIEEIEDIEYEIENIFEKLVVVKRSDYFSILSDLNCINSRMQRLFNQHLRTIGMNNKLFDHAD